VADSPKSLTANFTFATHNTERGNAEFRPLASIVCWQELSNGEIRDRLRADLPGYDHATFNDAPLGPGMNSISWDRTFESAEIGRAYRASEPKAGVSPARFVTVQPLRHGTTGLKVAAINTHFVSLPNSDPWRATQWRNHLSILAEVIAEVRAKGYVPLVGCDINKARWDLIPGLMEPRFEPLTVDRIGVPADIKATARLGTRGGSNHQPVIAKLSITK